MIQKSDKEAPEKFIDIDKSMAAKNPRLFKLMPSFLKRYIKKTLHEDELNEAMSRYRNRFGHDFVDAAMGEFGVHTNATGTENIPRQGGVIIAANHPLGGLDGIALMDVVGKYRKDIRFFVNDILMTFKNLESIFVPVNKHGRNTAQYTQKFEEVYASEECLLIFPAGLVSRRFNRKEIRDLEWKKSFITKAIRYEKNIVPVYIEGRNSDFFYNLASLRKKLGLKSNIEMFFLVDEMYKQRGKTLTFTFGEAVSWKVFSKDKPPEYWAEAMKRHLYALPSGDLTQMLPTLRHDSQLSK